MAQENKVLYRLPKKGQIFGVCAGLAEYFDMDVTILRIIFVILALATGGGMVLLYIILAIILPVSEIKSDNSVGEKVHKLGEELQDSKVVSKTRNIIGAGLILVGVWLLVEQLFPEWLDIRWDFVWPVILIVIGLFIVIRRSDGNR